MKLLFCIFCFCLVNFRSHAQQFDVDTLLYNGSTNKRINFVILGDGFTLGQMPDFIAKAEDVVSIIFNTSPFSEYKSHFNVFAIKTPSNQEGTALNPNNLIDNYFGSTFGVAGIDRLLVPTNSSQIMNVLATHLPEYDQVLMLVNTSRFGGSGGWLATSSIIDASFDILTHELGHSFADLADEYWAGPQYAAEKPNMTKQSSPSRIKWKNWLNDLGVGIYSHSGDNTWYRPHESCKMQTLHHPYCPICKEAIVRKIQQLTSPIDRYSPEIIPTSTNKLTFEVETLAPDPNTLHISWFLDNQLVKVNQNKIEVSGSSILASQAITCFIYDSTTFNRRTTILMNSITWDITKSTLDSRKILLNRNTLDTLPVTIAQPIKLIFYPNPFEDKLQVSYTLFEATPVELNIYSAAGALIKRKSFPMQQPGEYENEFNLRKEAKGVYILYIKTQTRSFPVKLLKKR